MENYNEMKERINTYDGERKTQLQAVKDALNQAVNELKQLTSERDLAAASGDIDMFTRKNAEVQIKEIAVKQMYDQLERYNYPVLSAADFQAWRTELFSFTNNQLGIKYRRVKELLDVVAAVLDEIDQISDQHADTYAILEQLTYGIGEDTGMDADGVKYNRRISFTYNKPDVLHLQLQTDTIGTIRYVLANLIETDSYI